MTAAVIVFDFIKRTVTPPGPIVLIGTPTPPQQSEER